jgi:hypothetical protein
MRYELTEDEWAAMTLPYKARGCCASSHSRMEGLFMVPHGLHPKPVK